MQPSETIVTRLCDRFDEPWSRRAGLTLILLLASISTVVGLHNGAVRSQDFQWSGTRALLHHVDPWAEYLRGDPQHYIYMQQNPNYLPVLYLIIAPLGLLASGPANLVWVLCNFAFAVASGAISARFYGLRGKATIAVIGLMLMATATRNTFGNGQQGLFVLLLWCVSLLRLRLTDVASTVSGISYFKFNFAPATALYLLLRGGVRAVVFSVLPSLLATVLLWLWLTGGHDPKHLFKLFIEPMLVSRRGYYPSGSDSNLMDVLQTVLDLFNISAVIVQVVTLSAAILLCFAILYVALRRSPNTSVQWQMALMATLNFGLFRHHSYDAVVLLLPLCYALRRWRDRRAQVAIAIIAYLWYIQRLVDLTPLPEAHIYIAQFVMLMVVLVMIYRLGRGSHSQSFTRPRAERLSHSLPRFRRQEPPYSAKCRGELSSAVDC